MPEGRIHLSNTITMSATLTAGALFVDHAILSAPDCALIVSGCLLGCVLSPDLDCDQGYVGLAILRKSPLIGPLISSLWRFYWLGYSRIMPHRSMWSHAPIVSTLIRLALCVLPVWGLELALNQFWAVSWRSFALVFAGLAISDIQHWAADVMTKDSNI